MISFKTLYITYLFLEIRQDLTHDNIANKVRNLRKEHVHKKLPLILGFLPNSFHGK